ncbi:MULTISPECIES: ATP-binding cassette domain-containing protein [unclassified Kribbella]|uniref:ATP-binding cassette domain-containing protein n=1 Tax=unclassified Kribbella TaxID=2644121 RepID=UPI003016EA9E
MPTQLSLHDITKSYDHRLVLDQITCAFPPGQVSGLIGENGSGKSTLLRIAAGLEPPTDGATVVAGSIGFLAQDNPLPLHRDVAALADHALADLRRIESRLRELEQLLAAGHDVLDEYGDLQTAFEVREGYDADARFARATHGLGLSNLPGDRVLSTLSGGELARLHLAAVLASSPRSCCSTSRPITWIWMRPPGWRLTSDRGGARPSWSRTTEPSWNRSRRRCSRSTATRIN